MPLILLVLLGLRDGCLFGQFSLLAALDLAESGLELRLLSLKHCHLSIGIIKTLLEFKFFLVDFRFKHLVFLQDLVELLSLLSSLSIGLTSCFSFFLHQFELFLELCDLSSKLLIVVIQKCLSVSKLVHPGLSIS